MKIISQNFNNINTNYPSRLNSDKKTEVSTNLCSENSLNILSNYNKSLVNFCSVKKLDEYKNPYANTPDEILDSIPMVDFKYKHKEIFKEFKFIPFNSHWIERFSKNGTKGPWKIHIYSDNELDWKKLSATIMPYLNDQDATYKTLNTIENSFDSIKNSNQKGKSFVIYPKNNEEFKNIAIGLNYIIKNNNLEQKNTSIKGDKELGSTGRIFYRYEYSTGALKNTFLDLNLDEEYELYCKYYEANRNDSKNNSNSYLASDMTILDDPWLNLKL